MYGDFLVDHADNGLDHVFRSVLRALVEHDDVTLFSSIVAHALLVELLMSFGDRIRFLWRDLPATAFVVCELVAHDLPAVFVLHANPDAAPAPVEGIVERIEQRDENPLPLLGHALEDRARDHE